MLSCIKYLFTPLIIFLASSLILVNAATPILSIEKQSTAYSLSKKLKIPSITQRTTLFSQIHEMSEDEENHIEKIKMALDLMAEKNQNDYKIFGVDEKISFIAGVNSAGGKVYVNGNLPIASTNKDIAYIDAIYTAYLATLVHGNPIFKEDESPFIIYPDDLEKIQNFYLKMYR